MRAWLASRDFLCERRVLNRPLKIVVFAHVPPPFHGQSYMVDMMLKGLGGDRRGRRSGTPDKEDSPVEFYHINAQFSDDITAVGRFGVRKLFRILRFCLEAIWCRLRYGACVLYYIPAPPHRVPFLRDCAVLAVCRPFFQRTIYHWQAMGLSDWLAKRASAFDRGLARIALWKPHLSVVLGESLARDAAYFASRKIIVVFNGVPDPCPEFEERIAPVRRERLAERLRAANSGEPAQFRVTFLALCTRDKGLFDALEAIRLANDRLTQEGSGLRMHLTVAGAFRSDSTRAEFDLWQGQHPGQATYAGFLSKADKFRVLAESDCLCFPSYYEAEAQPISVIEAMAFGLAIVGSNWRGIPEMLPPSYPHLVPIREPAAIAAALMDAADADVGEILRARFCQGFTEHRYVKRLGEALQSAAR